jgi:ribosomal-protein-alanine N-acetyltransferase
MSFIETDRLAIRKFDLSRDLDDMLEIYGDPETMRFIPCGVLTREKTAQLIVRLMERDEQNGFGIWPVVLKEERRVIGVTGITYIPEYGKDVEIAWTFNKAYHHHGYATEAARAVTKYALGEVGLSQIYALIDPRNAASIAVARRLGMDFDRIIRAYRRDVMRYRKKSA